MVPNLYKLTVVHHQERLQAVAEARQFNEASVARPGLKEWLWTGLKEHLVTWGKKSEGSRDKLLGNS